MRRPERSAEPAKLPRRHGRNAHGRVARLRLNRLDACRNAVDPVGRRAVGIVVKGIHVRTPDLACLVDAVPVLPDRRRTQSDRIQPRGKFLAQQQLVGKVVAADFMQRVQQIGRADKARGQPVAVLVQQAHQCLADAHRVVRQVKKQHQDAFGLRFRLRIFLQKRRADARLQRAVLRQRHAEHRARLDKQGGGNVVKRTGDQLLAACAMVASGVRIQPQPVAVVMPARPQLVGGRDPQSRPRGHTGDIIDPFFHAVELLGQYRAVAVVQIQQPRADARRVAPGRAGGQAVKAVAAAADLGDHVRYRAVFALIGCKVA